jgi:hypothetical protein
LLVCLGLLALVVVVAVGIALVAGAVRGGPTDGLSAGRPIRAIATLSPRTQLFGDTVIARIDLAIDPRRVAPKSLRIAGRFGPYTPVAGPLLQRHAIRGAEVVVWSLKLRCLDQPCRPRNAEKRITFPPARVAYTLGHDDGALPGSLVVEWPTLLVYSRVDPADLADTSVLDQPPWRAALGLLPEVSYMAPPGVLSGLLYVVGGVMIAGAFLLCVPFALREFRARAAIGAELALLPPLEQALMLLEATPDDNGAVEPRRQALELVAAELGRCGEQELELSARRLAWSEEPPAFEDTRALARSVRVAIGGESKGPDD